MKIALNEKAIASASQRVSQTGVREELADSQFPGLRLRINAGGTRTWVLGMRDPYGNAKRFALGSYPSLSLAKARDAARLMKVQIQAGADPIKEARTKRSIGADARAGVGTLGALLDTYEKTIANQLKSWPEARKRISSVFSRHLAAPIPTLTARDLQLSADGWSSKASAAAAVRYLRPILKWAAAGGRDFAPTNLSGIQPPTKGGRRNRVLSTAELHRLLVCLYRDNRPYRAILQFLLLTLSRREEAAASKWGDIDFKSCIWLIPITKNGDPHQVPLSRQALALLKTCLPTSPLGEILTPKPSALIFASSSGGRLVNFDRECKRLMLESGTEGWTRHDLRRTGATILGEMGVDPHVIEAALNHTSIHNQLAATYNRSRYRPQVARALQALADRLDEIRAINEGVADSPVD